MTAYRILVTLPIGLSVLAAWTSASASSAALASGNAQAAQGDFLPSRETNSGRGLRSSSMHKDGTGERIHQYKVPTPRSGASFDVAGPDGSVWFTEHSANKIGRISAGGQFSEFGIPTPKSGPEGIALGPDGAIWFTEYGGLKIARITNAGRITEFPIIAYGSPEDITAGPDGAMWFTQQGAIGRISVTGAETEYYANYNKCWFHRIVTGPDGALWFTDSGTNSIGRITVVGAWSDYALGFASPYDITVGPDNALWFTETAGNGALGRITVLGEISTFPTPDAPNAITSGPDGNLWFTLGGSGQIARSNTSGQMVEYNVPTSHGKRAQPLGITPGPLQSMWFVTLSGMRGFENAVGRIHSVTRVSEARAVPQVVPKRKTNQRADY